MVLAKVTGTSVIFQSFTTCPILNITIILVYNQGIFVYNPFLCILATTARMNFDFGING